MPAFNKKSLQLNDDDCLVIGKNLQEDLSFF